MNAPKALVIGESLIDRVRLADGTVTEHVGGSPANVALGLARLGSTVRFTTALASDPHGNRIADHLKRSGIELDDASWSLDRTSTAEAVIRPDGSAEYVLDIEWRVPRIVDVAAMGLVHAGSLALFLDPGAVATTDALARARHTGAVVSIDPNIRSALLPDHGVALRRFEDVARLSHVVKFSDEDANWLYPEPTHAEVIQHLLDLGADLAVMTRGADGSTLATRRVTVHQGAPTVVVADTVGAGDAFQSALLAWIQDHPARALRGLEEADVLAMGDFAARAAALTVQRVGAEPPLRSQLDVRPLHDRPRSDSL